MGGPAAAHVRRGWPPSGRFILLAIVTCATLISRRLHYPSKFFHGGRDGWCRRPLRSAGEKTRCGAARCRRLANNQRTATTTWSCRLVGPWVPAQISTDLPSGLTAAVGVHRLHLGVVDVAGVV